MAERFHRNAVQDFVAGYAAGRDPLRRRHVRGSYHQRQVADFPVGPGDARPDVLGRR